MKLIINSVVFLIVLMLPFALSSQTRKAIPAGRFESLSGIKVSHSSKVDPNLSTNSLSIWNDVAKNLPSDKNECYFLKSYMGEINLPQLITNKSFREIKKTDQGFDLLITSNLKNDKDLIKHLNSKGLVVLISSLNINDVMETFGGLELVVYQNQSPEKYYLLKTK